MRMSIQVKVSGFLAILLALSFGLSGWLATRKTLETMDSVSSTFLSTLREAGQERAQNVFASFETGARGSLERGEMEIFADLLDELGQIAGVAEIGLTNAEGSIVFSSRPEQRGRAMDPGRFQGAVKSGEKLFEQKSEKSLLLARGHWLSADCLGCHAGSQAGDLGGVLFVNYDMTDVLLAEAEVSGATAAAIKQSVLTGVWTGIGGLSVACIGVYVLFGFLVRKPLESLREIMQAMGQGDLTRRLYMHRQDEIGDSAGAMDEMAERLNHMVRRLRRSGISLQGITSEVTSLSHRVDKSANLQAQRVSETSEAVRRIGESTNRVNEGVEQLAVSSGEVTSSSLEMASSIEEVALNSEKVAQAVEEVGGSILEMAASIREVAANASVLKDSAEITASSIAQMDVSIKEVEGNAVKSAAIADSVRRDAESGKSSLDATLEGIQAIGKAARTTSEVIQSLSGKAQNIGQVLSVIEEVTDQTNLLALNAAIIAAQAGEKGKGFAVVAEEIRELADRTGISTREITQMIQGIQRETRQAVEAIFVAEKKVQEGETLSRQTGDLLGRIFAGVQETSAQMERIAVATAQQAAGSRMIRQAMENISQLINESARATREQDGGASLITQAAEQIKELAAQVRLSTREQSEASRVIARAMENVSEKIAGIRTACEMQQRESNQIVAALGDIQASTGENVEATRGLQKVVGILGEETGVLQQEMAAFEITEESGEPTAI